MTSLETSNVIALSDDARRIITEARDQEAAAETLALWVEVTGPRGAGYAYDLYFSELSLAPDDAAVAHDGDVTVVVPAASVSRLRGSRLEFSADGDGGLVLVNPNAPSPEELNPGVSAEVLAYGLTGPLATVALRVLDEQVNPAIASHGGRADLVALDEVGGAAYVKLSGGCQGCAMSRLTLTQGIETMLREAIPELTAVLDVTDHASGENPFYEAD